MDEKEYIVTVKEGVDWREVHEDLTKENQKQFIPNHKVPVDDLREINKRNTHYHLSDQEAAELRKDSKSKYGRQLCFLAKELTFSSVLPKTQQSFEFFE